MPDDSFHAFVKELFAGMGPVQIKRMFGGAGGFHDGLMFLLIADDTIYLKADDALKKELAGEGCGPFVWTPQSGPRKGEKLDLGYWRLPDSAMDDPDEAARWGAKALSIAKAKSASKKKAPKSVANPTQRKAKPRP